MSETPQTSHEASPLMRTLTAYAAGCLAAAGTFAAGVFVEGLIRRVVYNGFVSFQSLANLFNDTVQVFVIATGWTVAVAALPLLAAKYVIRARRWPRPAADMAAWMLVALGVLAGVAITRALGPADVILPAIVCVLAGLVAGWTYWMTAGRPG